MPRLSDDVVSRLSRRRLFGALASTGVSFLVSGCGLGGLRVGVSAPPPSSTAPANGPTTARARVGVATGVTAPTTPTAVPPTPTPAPRKMALWTARSDSPWLQSLKQSADLLTARRPNLTIEVSGGHEDFGEVVESFGTGQAPDVIEPGDLVPLAARSMVQPVDKYLSASTVDPANYVPAMWANGSWHGKIYGIPSLDHGAELGLAWNTSLTATASAPTTWDDLYTFGRQLTRRDANGAIQTLGFDPLDGVGGILDTVRDVTGQEWFDTASNKVTIDNPSYRSFLEGIARYYNAVGIEQTLEFRKTYHPLTNSQQSAINLGRQVAILNGYWSVAEVADFAHSHAWRFDFAWVPTQPASSQVQRLGGRVLAIPSTTPETDDAWSLIAILSGDETNRIFCDHVGTCAMTRSFLKSDGWNARPGMQFYVDSIAKANRLTSRSNNAVAGFAQEKWTQAIGQVLAGKQSVPDALKAAQADIQTEASRVHE